MQTITIAAHKLPAKTQVNHIYEFDLYFPLLITCTDNICLEQYTLKTHTIDYEKLTVDQITNFCK